MWWIATLLLVFIVTATIGYVFPGVLIQDHSMEVIVTTMRGFSESQALAQYQHQITEIPHILTSLM